MKFVDEDEKVAVFIDGPHLHNASKSLNFDVDYKKLRAFFDSGCYLLRMYYYTFIVESEEYTPLRPLTDWMQYNGYTVNVKPGREFIDSTGRRRVRGDINVDLAVDALELAPHVDHIVLVAGDASFVRLCRAVQAKGVRVSAMSSMKGSHVMIADEFRRAVDQFIELADVMGEFTRKPIPVTEEE